ncbi:MAG: LysM peptidoglycan-binding domain-containing protein, partial [Steroidobacteraceae bacterium]
STSGGLIHDPERLDVVYEAVSFPENLAPRERSKRIDATKQKYTRILRNLANGDASSEEAQRVRALWPEGTSRSRFEQAAEEVRFQLGQSDRFREGLVRSGAWKPRIEETFERAGLPRELAVLPHVESSFNTYAYSKVGAAGMWQFMRSTGRRFLRIDSVVDERLDPYRSTEAAVKFLEQNYAILGSWPLALTAYNHGPAGMRRAQEQLGTSDIAIIARKYQSRSFGFASRNFYVAFLAALEIDQNPEKYFGNVQRDPLDSSKVVELPNSAHVRALAKAAGATHEELKRLNPSLLTVVWNGSRPVPRGYQFRVPASIDVDTVLARLPETPSRDTMMADVSMEGRHRVRNGETLSSIATRYGVSFTQLARQNDLRHPFRLRVGQVLEVPGAKTEPPLAVVARTEPQPPPAVASITQEVKRYRVRRGDTLSRIAKKHGLTEEQLMEFNGLRSANFIFEGQVLALEATAEPIETVARVPVESVPLAAEVPAAPDAEPVTESEAEEQGPTLVPGAQAAATADPGDYSVHEDGTIRVQAAETLGHYAEWLDVRASRLRQLNRMSAATPVVIDRKLKLDFSKVSRSEFEATRATFHKQLQDVFFSEYRIADTESHVVQKGDSVWLLAERRYNIPVWLLRQYNPDVDLSDVRPGTKLVIPRVNKIGADVAAR